MGVELASYSLMDYRLPGNLTPNGMNWASKLTNAIAGPSVDMNKVGQPLWPWAVELSWSLFELAAAQRTGMPIDQAKYNTMVMKWNMDTDAMVYVGTTEQTLPTGGNPAGMLNSAAVTATAAVNGASGSPLWTSKTPQEKLNDVNTAIQLANTNAATAVTPDQMRLPFAQFFNLIATINSQAGSISILEFLRQNNASGVMNGRPLNIQAIKWLSGALRGVGTDRMYLYTNDKKYLQFPLVQLARTPLEQRQLEQMVTYYGKLGAVEHRYPETEIYVDGI